MNCGANMSIGKRWAVTYTKHLKQKRKVYQDGVLELCGSGMKVLLYDDSEKLIDSKFLKNEEVIECGQTLTFEAHLVDIGVLEESHIPLADVNITGIRLTEQRGAGHQKERKKSMLHRRLLPNYSNATNKNEGVTQKMQLESFGKPQSLPDASRTTVKEWNALYTAQITQKAKKFHDGFLRISVCGSYMDQVTLLNEEGVFLSSKYVKSSEFIQTGKTFELPNYLVEICELRTIEGELRKAIPEKVTNSSCSSNGNFISAREVINNEHSGNLSKGPSSHVACSRSSSFGKFKNRSSMATQDGDKKVLFHYKVTVPSSPAVENLPEGTQREGTDTGTTSHGEIMSRGEINKSLRDAYQILTTVRKPVPESNNVLEKLPMKLVQPAQFLKDAGRNVQTGQVHSAFNFNHLDVQSKGMILEDNFREKRQPNEPAKDSLKADSSELSAGSQIRCGSCKRSLESSAFEDLSNSGIMRGMGTIYEEKAPLHNSHYSVHMLPGPLTSETSADELNVGCSEKPPEGRIASASMYGKTNTHASSLPVPSHTATPGVSFSGEGLCWQLVSSTNETVPFAKSAISTLVEQQLPDSSGNILEETIADIEISATSGMKGDILRSVGKLKNDIFAQIPTCTKEGAICESTSVASKFACADIDNNKTYRDSEFESLSTKCHITVDFPAFDLGF